MQSRHKCGSYSFGWHNVIASNIRPHCSQPFFPFDEKQISLDNGRVCLPLRYLAECRNYGTAGNSYSDDRRNSGIVPRVAGYGREGEWEVVTIRQRGKRSDSELRNYGINAWKCRNNRIGEI